GPEGWVSEHLCSSVKSRDRRRSEREPDRPPPLQGTRSAGPNSRCPGGKILTAPAAPLLPGRRIGPQIGAETLLSALPVQFGNGVLQLPEHLAAAAHLVHQRPERAPQVPSEQHGKGNRAKHEYRPYAEPQHDTSLE